MSTKKVVSIRYILSDSVDELINNELENNPVTKDNLRFWMNNIRSIQTTIDLVNIKINNVLNSR